MARCGIQLYSLRTVDRTVPELLDLVADAGFDGIEWGNKIYDADIDAVIETLTERDLVSIGGHETLDPLETDFEDTVSLYESLDSRHIACPWLGPEHFESREAIRAASQRIEAVADMLEARDFRFHYHNHDHEFVDLDGEVAFDVFQAETTIPIELDLGHALAAGDDPVARVEALGDRAELLHVTDHDPSTGESVPIGHGAVDLDGLADAVATAGTEWLIYEYEGADPLDTLEEAATTIRELT